MFARRALLETFIAPRRLDRVRALASKPWLSPLNDVAAIDDLLAQVNPLWSMSRARARVEKIVDETADVKTFVLRPNRHWAGFAAGQHTLIDVEIDGRRQQRAYSLSSNPRETRLLSITVKRQRGGRVSNALHDRLRIGHVLGLSAAAGEFRLPLVLPGKILLLGAGSGVTPLMSMLHELKARDYDGDVVFLHASRNSDDVIFSDGLRELALRFPTLRWIAHHSEQSGRLDRATLAKRVPDYAERETFLCGPYQFMDWVRHHWNVSGIADRLRYEHFGALLNLSREPGEAVTVTYSKSTCFEAYSRQPLLAEAEAAGLAPKHGCRVGLCYGCSCRKISGAVENLLTGEISAQPNELIRLCISGARSDLRLEL